MKECLLKENYDNLKAEATVAFKSKDYDLALDKFNSLMNNNLEQLDVISENLFGGDFENEA